MPLHFLDLPTELLEAISLASACVYFNVNESEPQRRADEPIWAYTPDCYAQWARLARTCRALQWPMTLAMWETLNVSRLSTARLAKLVAAARDQPLAASSTRILRQRYMVPTEINPFNAVEAFEEDQWQTDRYRRVIELIAYLPNLREVHVRLRTVGPIPGLDRKVARAIKRSSAPLTAMAFSSTFADFANSVTTATHHRATLRDLQLHCYNRPRGTTDALDLSPLFVLTELRNLYLFANPLRGVRQTMQPPPTSLWPKLNGLTLYNPNLTWFYGLLLPALPLSLSRLQILWHQEDSGPFDLEILTRALAPAFHRTFRGPFRLLLTLCHRPLDRHLVDLLSPFFGIVACSVQLSLNQLDHMMDDADEDTFFSKTLTRLADELARPHVFPDLVQLQLELEAKARAPYTRRLQPSERMERCTGLDRLQAVLGRRGLELLPVEDWRTV